MQTEDLRREGQTKGVNTIKPLLSKGVTHLIFNKSCEWQIVEEISEVSPNVGVAILPQTLVVEAVYLGDLPGLVITTQNSDTITVAQFEGHKKGDSLSTE